MSVSQIAPKQTLQKITGAQATFMALDEAMSLDPDVVVLGEDLADPEGGGIVKATLGLSSKYGARVRTTPISEQAIMGAAIGAAIAGKRPVAEIMLMNFMTVAMDQIFNHAAKLRFMSGGKTGVPLTIRTMSGVGGGAGGQHSDMIEAWFAHTPGLKVVVPSNPADQYALLKSCIFDDDPCVFVETTMIMRGSGPAPAPGYQVPLGKANIVRAGTDVTVVGYGRPMHDVIAVAERLATQGVSVEVVDLRTIVPMDEATVFASAAKTRRVVIVHEAVTRFGVGAEIAARINEELFGHLTAPIERVGSRYTPVPFSKPLELAYMWSQERIEAAIHKTMAR